MGTGEGKQVQILLSTYNGQRFLREQLESYLRLDGSSEVKVLVRDDGSTDGTLDILQEYEEKYGFQVIAGENLGVNRSFFELLENRDKSCAYFALSDQDDVWLSSKLQLACRELAQVDPHTPALFGSCSTVVTQDLVPIGSTLAPAAYPDFFNAMVQNIIPGHTQVMNNALAQLLHYTDGVMVIDWWIYLVAAGLGVVCFTKEPTVLHRQHGSNSVGYVTSFLKKSINRLGRLKEGKAVAITKQLDSFYRLYRDDCKEEALAELNAYFLSQSDVHSRLRYIRSCNARREPKWENVIFKMMYLCGQYNLKDEIFDKA